jgi:hypothetical protein
VETPQYRQRRQPCPHDVIFLGQRGAKHGQDPISHRRLKRATILLHRVLDTGIERLHQAVEGIEVVGCMVCGGDDWCTTEDCYYLALAWHEYGL